MKTIVSVLAVVVASGSVTLAQGADPVVAAAKQWVGNYARRLPAAVEAMPADKFHTKPTPGHEEYSHLVAHMVDFNNSRCAFIAGMTPVAAVNAADPKEKLVAALKTSFDFCADTLSKLKDADLGQEGVFSPTRKASKAELLFHIVGTEYDHYAQAASYLRAAGVALPSAK